MERERDNGERMRKLREKWRANEEMERERKWQENEKIERK